MNQDAEVAVDMVIIGASTRAAAFSAIRAGFSPLCFDQYADADLQTHAAASRVPDYPDGLIPALRQLHSMPLIYCGGLENHPDVLQAASRHQLWGNSLEAVESTQDPPVLEEAARLARIGLPEWRAEDNPPPPDGAWLLKPRLGTGGRGIAEWTEAAQNHPTLKEPHFYQRRIEGDAYSACFIAPPEIGDIRFVGVTRQLIGESSSQARPFQWCGNVGPAALPIPVEHRIRRLGNVLKWKLGLKGLFGIDFILDQEENPWVVEVNPRYPASLELLEHATGIPLLRDHCACFDQQVSADTARGPAPTSGFLGKAVLFSPIPAVVEQPLANPKEVPIWHFPEIADLPVPGQALRPGDPVCTVYAKGASMNETRDKLQTRLRQISERLHAQSNGNGQP